MHHASVLSILTQVIQDNQAKTKLLRFVSSDDPHRGRRDVDGLLAAFLPSPRFRSAILNHAMYLPMHRAKDLTDFENRLNLVRMELEQLHKPLDESTLVVAFIHGLREEFKTAAQFLSTGAVDAFTLDDAVQHVRDSMLIVSTLADVPIFAFPAEAHVTPAPASVTAATQDAMATQLSTLVVSRCVSSNSVGLSLSLRPRS
jgi:hypothetical protein